MGRPRGFTLVEFLVFAAVGVLLAAVVLPALAGARRLAKPQRCKWNQAMVAEAIFLYAEDYDDAIPYTAAKIPDYTPFYWHVLIGRIPPEHIDKIWENWPHERFPYQVSDHNSPEFRLCAEGYVDYPSWGDNAEVPYEGAFVCPAFVDQVEPKSTWPGATSCHFSINGNVSGYFTYRSQLGQVTVTHLSDVRAKAVLIGDGNLNPGGNIRVEPTYRTDWSGRLFRLGGPSAPELYAYDFGPWTHQRHIGKWSLAWPCDFYGHPGDKCNLALADGHVMPVRDLDGNDWIIKPLDDDQEDANEQEQD